MSMILAIETGLGAASVALLRGAECVARATAPHAHANASDTLPMIEHVLAEGGASFDTLDALAVGIGPGSFTGIRIGLAAARGLALATGLPLVGIGTLEAAAMAAEADRESPLLVMIDAMRGQVYGQSFAFERGTPLPLSAPELLDAEGVRAWLQHWPQKPVPIAGNAGDWLNTHVPEHGTQRRGGLPDAAIIGRMAQEKLRGGDLPPALPIYVRPPDAKLPQKPAPGA